MNYLKAINAINSWCETDYLEITSQIIMFKLLSIFNGCGWKEEVTVDNQRLMSICQIKNKNTFEKYRNKLIELGWIEFSKGKKSHPNSYKISTKFMRLFDDSLGDSLTICCSNFERKTGDINKQKQKQKNLKNVFTDVNTSESSHISPMFIEFWKAYPRKENKPTAVRAFGKIKPMSREVLDKILHGIELWKNSEMWSETQCIPHPATFLNNKKWEDEIPERGENSVKREFKCSREYPE